MEHDDLTACEVVQTVTNVVMHHSNECEQISNANAGLCGFLIEHLTNYLVFATMSEVFAAMERLLGGSGSSVTCASPDCICQLLWE